MATENTTTCFILHEFFTNEDGWENKKVLAVCMSAEAARMLMKAKVLEDEYGFFFQGGVLVIDEDHIQSKFSREHYEGYVAYQVIAWDITSDEEASKVFADAISKTNALLAVAMQKAGEEEKSV